MELTRPDIVCGTIMYVLTDTSLGGSAQSLLDMLKGIRNRFRAVVVIPREGLIAKRLQQLHVKYYVIPFTVRFCKIGESSSRLEDAVFKEDYSAALQLQPVIRKEKVDLIHTNSSVCNVGAIAALMSGKPHIWHLRELLEEHFECEFIDGSLKRKLFENTEAFVAISNCVKSIYERRYRIKPVCIYNGLDTEKYICREGHPVNGNTFLLAGRISEGKGQWDAIQAVELLVNQGFRDILLTIVGDREQKMAWAIKKYLSLHKLGKNIRVLPFRQELSELRNDHACSLTCSKMEALGRTTIEAMLFGNIVIGADTGGTLEVIGNRGERGYLYRQGDYESLAEAMRQAIMEGEQEKSRKRDAARDYAQKTFALSTYITAMEQLYHEVLNRKRTKTEEEKDRLLERMQKRYDEITGRKMAEGSLNSENKFKVMFQYTELWLRIRQQGYSLAEFFSKRDIRRVAIYGMGFLGCDLYDELEGHVEIPYVMDQSPGTIDKAVSVKKMNEQLPYVDAIVITTISGEEEIQKALREKCSYTMIKLTEIIESYIEVIG